MAISWTKLFVILKKCPINISIQLDESTDVADCSQLIALVRYMSDGEIKEEFLFCHELKRLQLQEIL